MVSIDEFGNNTMSSRPLRIAVWYNLPSGGAKRALYNHMAGLKKRGHSIEVFRPPVDDEQFMPTSQVSDREHVFPWDKWQRTSWFYPRKIQLSCGEVFRFLQSADVHARLAASAIEQGEFDVLYSHNCMYMASPHIGRYVSIPKVLYLPEPNRPLYEPLPRLLWIADEAEKASAPMRARRRLRHWIDARSAAIRAREELINAKAFDRILVNSFFSREAVLRAYGVNSKVCYLGIDAGMFKNLGLPRERFVMGVGTLGPTKNVLLAVEAVGRVPAEIRPELVWVANMTDPPYRDRCVDRASELGVKFTHRSMVSDEELISLLNRASMMVYAPRLEPFGLAPLEANMCGLPVVAVAEGGVRETVVDGVNGLLADHDAALFGAAIARLLRDEPLRAKLGDQALERARTTWAQEPSIDRVEAELYDVAGLKP